MSPRNKTVRYPEEEPRYVISVAARILNTPVHTLRYYERIGIIEPFRSAGNIRLYSENDIMRVRRVKSLIEELGVNLAGVEVIMHMVERINDLQKQVEVLEKLVNKPDR
jgi:MerR family transcriptional regulator/heat shock protein HspR